MKHTKPMMIVWLILISTVVVHSGSVEDQLISKNLQSRYHYRWYPLHPVGMDRHRVWLETGQYLICELPSSSLFRIITDREAADIRISRVYFQGNPPDPSRTEVTQKDHPVDQNHIDITVDPGSGETFSLMNNGLPACLELYYSFRIPFGEPWFDAYQRCRNVLPDDPALLSTLLKTDGDSDLLVSLVSKTAQAQVSNNEDWDSKQIPGIDPNALFHALVLGRCIDRENTLTMPVDSNNPAMKIQNKDGYICEGEFGVDIPGPSLLEISVRLIWPESEESSVVEQQITMSLNGVYPYSESRRWIADHSVERRTVPDLVRNKLTLPASKSGPDVPDLIHSLSFPALVYLPDSMNHLTIQCGGFKFWVSADRVFPVNHWENLNYGSAGLRSGFSGSGSSRFDMSNLIFPLGWTRKFFPENNPLGSMLERLRCFPGDMLAQKIYQSERNQTVFQPFDCERGSIARLIDAGPLTTVSQEFAWEWQAGEKWTQIQSQSDYLIEVAGSEILNEVKLFCHSSKETPALRVLIDGSEMHDARFNAPSNAENHLFPLYLPSGTHSIRIVSDLQDWYISCTVSGVSPDSMRMKNFYPVDKNDPLKQVFRYAGGPEWNRARVEIFAENDLDGKTIFTQIDTMSAREIRCYSNGEGKKHFAWYEDLPPGNHLLRIFSDQIESFEAALYLPAPPWKTPSEDEIQRKSMELHDIWDTMDGVDLDAAHLQAGDENTLIMRMTRLLHADEVKGAIELFLAKRAMLTENQAEVFCFLLLEKSGYFHKAFDRGISMYRLMSEPPLELQKILLRCAWNVYRMDIAADLTRSILSVSPADPEALDSVSRLDRYWNRWRKAEAKNSALESISRVAIEPVDRILIDGNPVFDCVEVTGTGGEAILLRDEFLDDACVSAPDCSRYYFLLGTNQETSIRVDCPGVLRVNIRPVLNLSDSRNYPEDVRIRIGYGQENFEFSFPGCRPDRSSLTFPALGDEYVPGRPISVDLLVQDDGTSDLDLQMIQGIAAVKLQSAQASMSDVSDEHANCNQPIRQIYMDILHLSHEPVRALIRLMDLKKCYPHSEIIGNLEQTLRRQLSWQHLKGLHGEKPEIQVRLNPAELDSDPSHGGLTIAPGENLEFYIDPFQVESCTIENRNQSIFADDPAELMIVLNGTIIGRMGGSESSRNFDIDPGKANRVRLVNTASQPGADFNLAMFGLSRSKERELVYPERSLKYDRLTEHDELTGKVSGPTLIMCDIISETGSNLQNTCPLIAEVRTPEEKDYEPVQLFVLESPKEKARIDKRAASALMRMRYCFALPVEQLYDIKVSTPPGTLDVYIRLYGCTEKTSVTGPETVDAPEIHPFRTSMDNTEIPSDLINNPCQSGIIIPRNIPVAGQSGGTWLAGLKYQSRFADSESETQWDLFTSESLTGGIGYQKRFEAADLFADISLDATGATDFKTDPVWRLDQDWSLNSDIWELRPFLSLDVRMHPNPETEYAVYADLNIRRSFKILPNWTVTPLIGGFYRDFSLDESDIMQMPDIPNPLIYSGFDDRHDIGIKLGIESYWYPAAHTAVHTSLKTISAGDNETGILGPLWGEFGIRRMIGPVAAGISLLARNSFEENSEPDRSRIEVFADYYCSISNQWLIVFTVFDRYTFETKQNIVEAGFKLRFSAGRFFRDLDPYRFAFERAIEQQLIRQGAGR